MIAIESKYSGKLHPKGVDKIASQIKGDHSLTIVAPSGFGKSSILRYISYNRKYRRRSPHLRKIEFVYIDLLESSLDFSALQPQLSADGTSTLHIALHKILIKAFNENLILHGYEPFVLGQDTDDYLETLERRFPNKTFYIILDNVEELIENPKYAGYIEYFRYLRNRHKHFIEFIFPVTNLKLIEPDHMSVWGTAKDLITHKIVFLSLQDLTYRSVEPMNLFESITDLFFGKTKKEHLEWANKMSNGYWPYAKYLVAHVKPGEKLAYSQELEHSTSRLTGSLTTGQKRLIMSVINHEKIKASRDLDTLMNLGIIRNDRNQLSLFSPIFSEYFKIIYHPES